MINDKLLFVRDGFCLTIPKAEETGSAEEHPASNKIMCCVPLLPLLRSSGEGGHANQGLRPQWSSPWTSPLAIIRLPSPTRGNEQPQNCSIFPVTLCIRKFRRISPTNEVIRGSDDTQAKSGIWLLLPQKRKEVKWNGSIGRRSWSGRKTS